MIKKLSSILFVLLYSFSARGASPSYDAFKTNDFKKGVNYLGLRPDRGIQTLAGATNVTVDFGTNYLKWLTLTTNTVVTFTNHNSGAAVNQIQLNVIQPTAQSYTVTSAQTNILFNSSTNWPAFPSGSTNHVVFQWNNLYLEGFWLEEPLTNSGVTPGTYGNSTNIGQFTVTAQGIITAATNIAISSFTGSTGTVINAGVPVIGNVPYYTDTTGTNISPSAALSIGASTNVSILGVLSANDIVSTNTITIGSTNVAGELANKITGPSSATDEAIMRFDSTTGKLGQNSTWRIGDTGNGTLGDASAASLTMTFNLSGATDPVLTAGNGALTLDTSSYWGWTDARLNRDAANTLAQRNGANAQTFNLYNTYTDASNYERGFARWSGNIFEVGTIEAGTGSSRTTRVRSNQQISFSVGGTDSWRVSSANHWIAITDNTYDIGASGATRPRNEYLSGALWIGGTTNTTSVRVGGTLKVDTTTTGNVGAGEDNLIQYTIPANVLTVNGDTLEFRVAGSFAATANSKRVKVFYGATTLLDTTSLIFNGLDWSAHGIITRTGAATQKCTTEFTIGGTLLAALTTTITDYTTAAETLSGTVVFKCTGEDTGGVPADNAVVQEMMQLKVAPNGN